MLLSELKTIIFHRRLLLALTRREILGQVKGSILGIYWSLLEPLMLLAIYTVVFHFVLKIRMGAEGGPYSFSLYLFCGLLPFLAISRALNRSSTVIMENRNLIKKLIFPSEILPLNMVLSALVSQFFGFVILILGVVILNGRIGWTVLLLPLLLLPQILLTAGLAWLVASLGVFIRDTRQAVSLLMVAWMFLTPIFYDESYVARIFPAGLYLNPLADLLAGYRAILIRGQLPDWTRVGIVYLIGGVLCLFGLWWFSRSKKAFIDVI